MRRIRITHQTGKGIHSTATFCLRSQQQIGISLVLHHSTVTMAPSDWHCGHVHARLTPRGSHRRPSHTPNSIGILRQIDACTQTARFKAALWLQCCGAASRFTDSGRNGTPHQRTQTGTRTPQDSAQGRLAAAATARCIISLTAERSRDVCSRSSW